MAGPVPGPVPAAVPRPAARGQGEGGGQPGRGGASHAVRRVPASAARPGARSRRALLAAGGIAAGQALFGCAPQAGRATAPTPSHRPRTISAMLDVAAYFGVAQAFVQADAQVNAYEAQQAAQARRASAGSGSGGPPGG